MILTGFEDRRRGFLSSCPSSQLARQNQSKDWIRLWKPICHLPFSKTNSAFNVPQMNGSMSNLRRARELTTCACGCVRSSHQRGQRGRVSASPPAGKSSCLLFVVSAEHVSLDGVAAHMLMTCKAHWPVLIGKNKKLNSQLNSAMMGSDTIPEIAGPPSVCLSSTQDCGVCLSCPSQGLQPEQARSSRWVTTKVNTNQTTKQPHSLSHLKTMWDLKSSRLIPVFGMWRSGGQSEVPGLGIKPPTLQPLHSPVMHADPSVIWECFVFEIEACAKPGSKIKVWTEEWLQNWCMKRSVTLVCRNTSVTHGCLLSPFTQGQMGSEEKDAGMELPPFLFIFLKTTNII